MTGGLVGFLIVIVAIVILIITIHRRRHSETFMKREVCWLFTHIAIFVISLLISLYAKTFGNKILFAFITTGSQASLCCIQCDFISKIGLCFPKCYRHLGFTRNYSIYSLLIFLLCFYVNKHGRYFLVFLYRDLAVTSRLKSSIQLNPERKIISHCNRLPHRKSSSTTPCIASRNNNLAIFRTINPNL